MVSIRVYDVCKGSHLVSKPPERQRQLALPISGPSCPPLSVPLTGASTSFRYFLCDFIDVPNQVFNERIEFRKGIGLSKDTVTPKLRSGSVKNPSLVVWSPRAVAPSRPSVVRNVSTV